MSSLPNIPDSEYFSYVDTTLRTIYFNLKSCYEEEAVKELHQLMEIFETSPKSKKELLNVIIEFNFKKNGTLNYIFFHEWYHYLQALAYPYLYYLSFIELKTLISAQESIKAHGSEIDLSDSKFIQLEDAFYNNLTYQTYNYRFYWNGELLSVDTKEINPPRDENVFCLIDLIENSTSIFHYKIIFAENATAKGYWTWIRNPTNRSYKNLFLFLARIVGYERAYDILPSLALLSFYTTEPLHAFCTLFNKIGSVSMEPEALLLSGKVILGIVYKQLEFGLADYLYIQDTPVGLITDAQFEKLLSETAGFHLHRAAVSFYKHRQSMEKVVVEPGSKEHFEILARDYQPVAIHYNFTDFITRNTGFVYQIAEEDRKDSPLELQIAEWAKIKDTVLSLTTPFNRVLPKSCHHSECSYYQLDFCRRWNAIPGDYRDCFFPVWFALNFDKEILPEEQKLIPLLPERRKHFDQIRENLNSKVTAKGRWDYYFDPNLQVFYLMVSRATVENLDVEYVESFIDMLSDKNSIADISNKIALVLSDYRDVPEELFQIPDVIRWFQLLKKSKPELFYFICFDPATKQKLLLLPMFIRYYFERLPDNQVSIRLDNEDWDKFLINELVIFNKFCTAHQLDPNYYYSKTFSN